MLNIVKLCVGVRDVAHLKRHIASRDLSAGQAMMIVTRSTPKRRDEILPGGSLYWVIGGSIRARQEILDLQPVDEGDGIMRCGIVLDPKVVDTSAVPYRAFQGWRYLQDDRAPPDMGDDDLPDHLRSALAELGLA